jgi:O-antigen ligase
VVLGFVAASVVVIAIIPGGITLVRQKLTLNDFSGQVRKAQWAETWQMLKDDNRIITGAGLANYQKAIEPYHVPGIFYNDGTDKDFRLHVVFNDDYKRKVWRPVEIYLYPHNIILNFWTELGLVGVLLFVWIFALVIYYLSLIIYHSKKNKDNAGLFLALGILGAFIVIIVHGLVDVPYFKNDLACIFWVLIALLSLLKLQQKNLSN